MDLSEVSLAPVYRTGDIEIDAARGILRRGGREVHVRPKSFRILVYLLSARDRLVSREELMELFWKGTAVTDDSLAQCIAELRRSMGDSSRQPSYLQTVPKLGYRFVAPVEEVAQTSETLASRPDSPAQPITAIHSKPSKRNDRWLWITAAVAVMLCLAASISAIAHRSTAPRVSPKFGEVAWWKLDEGGATTIRDSIQGRSGVLPEGVTWVQGVTGSALRFAGTETSVRGTDVGAMPRGSVSRTLAAWVRTNTTNADSTTVFQYGNSKHPVPNDSFFLMLLQTGFAAFGNHYESTSSRTRVDDGRWHQIAGVFDQGRTQLFVDGMREAEGTINFGLDFEDASDWAIGRGNWGGTSFRGDIDDIRVYERPLRAAEIQGLHRCMSGGADLKSGANHREYYFASVHGPNVELISSPAGESSARIRNRASDFAGVMFVERQPGCPVDSIFASDVGQDLSMEVEVRLTHGPVGEITEAGPYFRCRRSAPGDGLIGGTSAGYWVQLLSTGLVRVKRLHPVAVVAFSKTPERFDPSVFHKIEIAAKGEELQVALDGQVLTFDQGGVQRSVVRIPPRWETANPVGTNRGSAGVAFGSEPYRNRAGGQEARNIRLKPYRPL